ncbi:hypothetical protein DH2020_031529 [Rehmannia glutinosa]|uniref:Uncharacterized protein n=1 Tax=Rehmannia glutinosa TaxID=99300 RepID=A0ABR0VL46_REHGL
MDMKWQFCFKIHGYPIGIRILRNKEEDLIATASVGGQQENRESDKHVTEANKSFHMPILQAWFGGEVAKALQEAIIDEEVFLMTLIKLLHILLSYAVWCTPIPLNLPFHPLTRHSKFLDIRYGASRHMCSNPSSISSRARHAPAWLKDFITCSVSTQPAPSVAAHQSSTHSGHCTYF